MRILFHDVDGCLNAPDGADIPRANQNFSEQQSQLLKELGIALDASTIDLMVINTGRSLEETRILVEAIKSTKLKYLIAEHGAIIFDVESKQPLIRNSAKHSSKYNDCLEGIKEFIQWYKITGHSLLKGKLGTDLCVLEKVANLTLEIPASMNSTQVFEQVQKLVREDSPFAYEQFVFHNSVADGFIDVMSKIDKGDGIDIILEHIGKPQAETIAVGNGLNDLPMLEKADICLCPSNSEQEVKDFCQKVAGINSEYHFIKATLDWLTDHQQRA